MNNNNKKVIQFKKDNTHVKTYVNPLSEFKINPLKFFKVETDGIFTIHENESGLMIGDPVYDKNIALNKLKKIMHENYIKDILIEIESIPKIKNIEKVESINTFSDIIEKEIKSIDGNY